MLVCARSCMDAVKLSCFRSAFVMNMVVVGSGVKGQGRDLDAPSLCLEMRSSQ